MERIADTLQAIMGNLSQKKQTASIVDAEAILKKILTKKELKHIKFNNFRKGRLSIRVDSSSWLYEFGVHKNELLEKLRREKCQVEDIRFFVG